MTKSRMQISAIRSKEDHRQAVARIEGLMGAAPNTLEGDELDLLATLVDAYEATHFVINAPSLMAGSLFVSNSSSRAERTSSECLQVEDRYPKF